MAIEQNVGAILHSIFRSNIDLTEDSFEVKGREGYILAQLKKPDHTVLTVGAKWVGEMLIPLNTTPLSQEERNQLISKLLDAGFSANDVSRMLGVSTATVYRFTKKLTD